MLNGDLHLSDQELLLFADQELPPRRASKVRSHLASCQVCCARLTQFEATIGAFVDVYQNELNRHLPDGDRSSAALLNARLSETAAPSRPNVFFAFVTTVRHPAGTAAVCLALIILFVVARVFTTRQWTTVEASSLPRIDLTPGATTAITKGEACRVESSQTTSDEVPAALQEAVFREYGINHPRPRTYEVDYLITPELGGANNIRNLWPEPYFTTVWNAHVKDELERHLHDMVCTGQLELATAQHDISADWIGAYKKYFHTDRPLSFLPR